MICSYRSHELDWLLEPLRAEESYCETPMFGCLAAYVHGNLVLVLAAKEDTLWSGVLVPTSREHHGSLMAEFSSLVPHEKIGKWLYQADCSEDFEDVTTSLVTLIRKKDPRLGVPPAKA